MELNNTIPGITETFSRLSNKPGVSAALVVDRQFVTILMATGSFSSFRDTKSITSSDTPGTVHIALPEQNLSEQKDDGAQVLATMVWKYVNATETLVQGLDSEDDIKILRLRTKKHELVIIPDSKYIFVVVNDTPSGP